MRLSRGAVLVIGVFVGLMSLPACLVTSKRTPVQEPVVPAPAPTVPTSGTEFGTLPRAPGERIPLREEPSTSNSLPVAAQTPVPPKNETPAPFPAVPVAPVVDPPLVSAMRAFLDNRPEQAREHLKALDKPNQELMLQLIPAIVRASQMNLSTASPTEMGVLAGQLEGPVASLAARSPLYLDKTCFCKAVKNFGRYDPLPDRSAFKPGSIAGLYVEVRNAPSEPVPNSPDGEGYVTRLACSLQIRDPAGNPVEQLDRNRKRVPTLQEMKQDYTRSPIRDYFLVFWFEAPTRPGAYTITFEIQDPATGRAVSKTMPFRVQ